MEAIDTTTSFPWAEVSIGVGAVFVLYIMVRIFGSIVNKILAQLDENRKDYTKFVLENNHNNTSRIEKSTEAMVKTSEAIGAHTELLKELVKKLDK